MVSDDVDIAQRQSLSNVAFIIVKRLLETLLRVLVIARRPTFMSVTTGALPRVVIQGMFAFISMSSY